MLKILSAIQPYIGIIAIVYPALQNFVEKKYGYVLPDFGTFGDVLSQVGGTALVAKAHKI